MKVILPASRRARIEILPLIDIVFLLLVFFIYAMLSMAVHRGLPVNLPTSRSAEIDQKLILSVTLKADGSLYVDRQAVDHANLVETLKELSQDAEKPGVLLFADHSIDYQTLFHVLDQIRQAGISRISLQAEAERVR
jgi:biopolymer transport protein ExbD